MALQLPAMPNFNVQTPDILGAQQKMLELRALQGNIDMQPLQKQAAQQSIQAQQGSMQAQQLANQEAQAKLQSQQAMVKAWSDPQISSSVAGNGADVTPAVGFAPGFDPNKMIKTLVSKGVLPQDAMAQASSFLELSKNLSLKTKDDLSNYKEAHQELGNLIGPISELIDNGKLEEASPALEAAKQKVASGAIPGLDPQDAQLFQQADVMHLKAISNLLNLGGQLATFHKGQMDAAAAGSEAAIKKMELAEKGSPLTKMENDPSILAGDKLPASMAYLQGKVGDPDPSVSVRAKRLLSTAELSQKNQLAIEAAKKATDQAILDGDPAAAAKLLVEGTVAPSQLISSRKPEFAQKAFSTAAQLQPGWDARKAEADFKVASSPAQVSFFGSAKSLTDKGGTLDQLAAAGKDIPDNQIPIFNTVADALKASTGSGPVAKYAAISLGVADDYAKVMGGGQGSDTSREQALRLISAKQSPEQRAASIEGIRGAVDSQTNSRIGKNTVLQKMYGSAPATSGVGGGSASFSITAPNNKTYTFKDQDSLDSFKKRAGIQ